MLISAVPVTMFPVGGKRRFEEAVAVTGRLEAQPPRYLSTPVLGSMVKIAGKLELHTTWLEISLVSGGWTN